MSTDQPILPYGGWQDPNSGFAAGSDTSEERARRDDADGTTSRRQQQTLSFLSTRRWAGATWQELGAQFGWHHGQSSGVLSVLHKDGRIARLTVRRNRCSVYVLPEFINDRTTQPHGGRPKQDTDALLTEIAQLESVIADLRADRSGIVEDYARITENFTNLLSVYTSDQSLVAVSRIKKALNGRYP